MHAKSITQCLSLCQSKGADACIIVYACNSPTSASRIESWYNAFVERCPLNEGQERTFPFICVGNKHDLLRSTAEQAVVREEEVLGILQRLCPPVEPDRPVSRQQKPSAMPSGCFVLLERAPILISRSVRSSIL